MQERWGVEHISVRKPRRRRVNRPLSRGKQRPSVDLTGFGSALSPEDLIGRSPPSLRKREICVALRRGSRGGALGRAPTLDPAPSAQVPSSQGQKEGTLVSLEWLFNTIQA